MKIFSVDAETDGLYGAVFAIGATVRENGKEIASFQGRLADSFVTYFWVKENVLPALKDMPITHTSSEQLEESFWAFWFLHKDGATAIAHCGSPVETGLFRRCVERDMFSRVWSAPFPLHEVGTLLLAAGKNPHMVDDYIAENKLPVPFEGTRHHPLYDAVVAAIAWEHLFGR